MAISNNLLQFTGSVGNMSSYRLKGTDKYVIRTKGGGSKKKIKKAASCKRIRENAAEFGTRASAGRNVRYMLTYLKHLADYNITPRLNSLASIVQQYDAENLRGERVVRFSECRHLLPGFSLNEKYPFDGIIRHPLQCEISRETNSATVTIPALRKGVNLYLPWKAPLYRFIVSLGVLTDCYKGNVHPPVKTVETDWQMSQVPLSGQELTLTLENIGNLDKDQTLVVSVGIEMGEPFTNEIINRVKNTGSAKILAVG